MFNKLINFFILVFLFNITPSYSFDIKEISSLKIGEGDGYVEIIKYHALSKSLFVTSRKSKKLERILITNQKKLNQLKGFDLLSGKVTSVDIHKNLIATSIKSEMIGFKGMVKIFNIKGKEVANYEVGFSPDNLSFSPDGNFILTANEGEPNDDYSIDPEGSFTLIDISNDLVNGNLTEISFKNFDKPKKFRIVRPNASLASDVEPAYIYNIFSRQKKSLCYTSRK